MKKFLGVACCLFFGMLICMSQVAKADLLELRVGAGMTAADFDDLDKSIGETNSGVSSDDMQNFNIDLMVNIPVSPLNVGVRYEIANQDQSGGSVSNGDFASWDLETSKILALVDFRFLDNVIYVGPILGLGYATSDFDLKLNNDMNKSSLEGMNYLIGLEAGVHLGKFIVGGELGYEGLDLDSPTGITSDVDLSGVYGKVMLGISFL